MPHDISEDVYRYLARDWGLKDDALTDTKCAQLTETIPDLRNSYHHNRRIAYHKSLIRRAYLAAFAPRYAYILHSCLRKVGKAARELLSPWNNQEGVMCLLGGGPACEVFGLMQWLYRWKIRPRYLHVIIADRERHWRSFHNFLFSDLCSQRFRKTMIVPSYESVDFPVPGGKDFDRTAVNYNFAQTSLLAEARLISVINCLSELADHRGFACHLRYLTRLAWNPQLVICADSAAKKRRPRMSWLLDFFAKADNFQSKQLFTGIRDMTFDWLHQGETSQRIFRPAAPRWENSISRWVYIARTGQG
jgi:hypothetical protein